MGEARPRLSPEEGGVGGLHDNRLKKEA